MVKLFLLIFISDDFCRFSFSSFLIEFNALEIISSIIPVIKIILFLYVSNKLIFFTFIIFLPLISLLFCSLLFSSFKYFLKSFNFPNDLDLNFFTPVLFVVLLLFLSIILLLKRFFLLLLSLFIEFFILLNACSSSCFCFMIFPVNSSTTLLISFL